MKLEMTALRDSLSGQPASAFVECMEVQDLRALIEEIDSLRARLAQPRPDDEKNTWWFCTEAEYPEEGSHLIAAPTAEAAEAILRERWGHPAAHPEIDECEVNVAPADDLDVIEKWLRSEDPKDITEAKARVERAEAENARLRDALAMANQASGEPGVWEIILNALEARFLDPCTNCGHFEQHKPESGCSHTEPGPVEGASNSCDCESREPKVSP